MIDEKKNELTPEEQSAFKSLPREAAPPAHLEAKVADALRSKGLLTEDEKRVLPFRFGWLRLAGASAALLLLGFLAGLWWQSQTVGPVSHLEDQARYLLILRNPPETFRLDIPRERLRTEYTAWAYDPAHREIILGGEELRDHGRLLHPREENEAAALVETLAAADRAISGYFLIRAANYQEAVEFAQTCPHIGYGGTIEVRAIQQ
jgi:hypothetical protein